MKFRNLLNPCPRGRKRQYNLWISAVACTALCVPAAASNLVGNGSFETLTGGETASFKVDDPSGDTMLDWSTTPTPPDNILTCLVYLGATTDMCGTQPTGGIGDTLTLWSFPGGGNGESPDGGNYILADADSTYSTALNQTITGLVDGKTYKLQFWQAAGQENGFGTAGQTADDTWKITLGAQNFSGATMAVAYKAAAAWNLDTITFTYNQSATSQVLSFLATSTAPAGQPPFLMLDGVSLAPSVPEPATWSFMAIAGVVICLAKKRRR